MKLLLFILLTAAISLGGCGSGEDPPERAPRPVRLTPENEVGGLKDGRAAKGQNACRHARVTVGSNPGAIDFVVYCSGSRADSVVFALQRYLLTDSEDQATIVSNRKETILGHRRFPGIKGKGALSRYGRCDQEGEVLTCNAEIDGPVAISGRLWVEPARRCAVMVSLVGITYSRCGKGACFRSQILDELFRARPKGC